MNATPNRDPWSADIEVTPQRARAAIAAQFPWLCPLSMEEEGEGWDNAAYRVNGTYVFRFPRRSTTAKLIERETRVLPEIARRLPVAVPFPEFAGRPSDDYPWPFAGYRRLDGRELSSLRPPEEAYAAIARDLGTFLRALHALDAAPLLAAGLPRDEIGRLDGARMMPKLEMRLRELKAAQVVSDDVAITAAAESLKPVLPRPPASVVHGDLYARHVLVDERFRVSGIIDWGDVHYGDPAVDLSVAFSLFTPAARAQFFAAYGPIEEEVLTMARFRAIYHSAMVAHYGHRIGDGDLLDAGVRGLSAALQ